MLQRTAGNAAVAQLMSGRATLQRQGGGPPAVPPPVFTLNSLNVAGATPVAGEADTFVGDRGSTVTVTANVGSTGTPPTARDIRWSGGRRGPTVTSRLVRGAARSVVRATVAGTSLTTTTFLVRAPAPPAANPVVAPSQRKIGRANPGGNFGLTVVTIGRQGITAPTYRYAPYFTAGRWSFRLERVRHGYKVGVASQGHRSVTGPRSVSSNRLAAVVADLTPPAAGAALGPTRATFWNRTITTAHEQAHVDRFYSAPFWGAAMRRFETTVETATVPFASATARTPGQVRRAQDATFDTAMTTEHTAADTAEIGGSEVACHGVSNPMYTALLARIVAAVRPPAATGLAATPSVGAVTLAWNQVAAVTSGARIERSSGRGPYAPIGTVAAGTLTFTDAGLPADTRFRYRVVARGGAGGIDARPANVGARTPATP